MAQHLDKNMDEIQKEIERIVGDGNIVQSLKIPEAHESVYFHQKNLHKPAFAVLPITSEDILQVLKVANREKINIVTWGGGTATYSGATMAPENSIIICLQRLNKIIEIDEADETVTVQAGITIKALNRELKRRNLWWPHDPESKDNATVGGSISIDGVGTFFSKYGSARDMVLSVKIAFPDGQMVSIGRRVGHSIVGYDFLRLFTGSEGTLGIIVEATLKIDRIPESRIYEAVLFEDIGKAARASTDLLDSGFRPEAFFVEDFTRFYYNVVESNTSLDGAVKAAFGSMTAALILSFSGSKEFVETNIKLSLDLLTENGGRKLEDNLVRDAWWYTKTELLYQMPPELREGDNRAQIATVDVCIPIGTLSWWNEQYREMTKKYELFLGGMRAYIGPNHDLMMAQRVVFDDSNLNDVKKYLGWVEELSKLAVDIGGTMSSNLGVGSKLVNIVEYEMQESAWIVRMLKKTFDPNDIMNRGKKIIPS